MTLFSEWETRACLTCLARKPSTEFARRSSTCRPCAARAYSLRRRFGLSLAEYAELLAKQSGACAICGRPPGKTRLAVDHNHKTGDVRGLLCWACNRGLAAWRDDVSKMQRAVLYLMAAPYKAAAARLGRVTNKVKKRRKKKCAPTS